MKVAVLLLALAAPLGAQGERARLEGRVPAASLPAIDSLLDVAKSEQLPTEPLVQKAIEGGAKHVSAERIIQAVERNLDQLRAAQTLLERSGDKAPSTPAEVMTVVWAHKRGLSDSIIERVITALPSEPRSSALHAVADLLAHRFAADSAASLILDAVGQGVRGVRLLDVSGAALLELQRGHTRAEALAIVRAELPNVPAPPPPGRGAVLRAHRPVAVSGDQPAP